MTLKKIPSWIIVLLLLIVIVSLALWLRVVLPYNQVFVGDWVKMTGVDAYFYMRLFDNLINHFPNLTQFDPYYIFPEGQNTGQVPIFFAYLIAAVAWLIGLGSPGQHFADVIAVYIPPILAALTVILVYFIGKMWENRWTGLLAALMLAVMPGEFLNRSLLGYTDQHIAEVFWSTLFILLVIWAFKSSEGIGPAALRGRGLKPVIRPAVAAILGGIVFGIYMLTWVGAPLFALILLIFLAVRIIMDYFKGHSTVITGAIGAVIFVTGLLVYLPGKSSLFTLLSLFGAIAVIAVLVVMAEIMARQKIRGVYFVSAIAGLALIGALATYIFAPDIFASAVGHFMGVFGWNPNTTIMEVQPLLLQQGQFTLAVAVGNYTSGLLLGVAGLVLLIWRAVKKPTSTDLLIIIWCLTIFMASLAMRRFCYYFSVNIALLSGYFAWWILQLAGFGKEHAAVVVEQPIKKTKAARKRQATVVKRDKARPVVMGMTLILVLAAMIYPNLGPLPDGEKPSIDLATRPLFAPSDAWCESLDWMRVNTPEPLGNADAYYEQYKSPGTIGGFVSPSSDYGVLAWWDYGYWITRIGRRIPFSNPGTSATRGEAQFFTAQDEVIAENFTKDMNIRYVIVDNEIASYDAKFYALPLWVGSSYKAYYDVYLEKQNDKYIPVLLFYPEYYRSMVVRLYNFDGKEVVPEAVNVIGYKEMALSDGNKYKTITEKKKFNSYHEAELFVNSKPPGSYRIVGEDSFKSPVPLDALKNYKLAHGSTQKTVSGSGTTSLIKIFEYQP